MNFLISLAGWALWNLIAFRIEKDKFDDEDKEFPIKTYARKTWENWVTSLVMIPVLLFLGYRGLGLNPLAVFGTEQIGWNDTYYLGAGFFTEVLMYTVKKWKGKQ
jgi:hypothetical protein